LPLSVPADPAGPWKRNPEHPPPGFRKRAPIHADPGCTENSALITEPVLKIPLNVFMYLNDGLFAA
jgi:hypothetical protein